MTKGRDSEIPREMGLCPLLAPTCLRRPDDGLGFQKNPNRPGDRRTLYALSSGGRRPPAAADTMTSPEHDEEAVFKTARRLATGEERRAYFDPVCDRDEALRGRGQDLLRVDEEERRFLAAPPTARPK